MASLSAGDWDGFMADLTAAATLPDEVAEAMIDAEADIIMEAQRQEAAALGMYQGAGGNSRDTSDTNQLPGQSKSYSTGELSRSIKKSKMKTYQGQRAKHIYFAGSRQRGKTRTKNSEIAFYNEFGSKTINARNFVRVANEKSADAALAAAEKVHDAYLKSKNL